MTFAASDKLLNCCQQHFGTIRELQCRKGGGRGFDPCLNGLGHLILRRIVYDQRGICLVWGVWTLARMVWGTCAVKIEVQMAFAQVGPEIKCPRVPVWVKGRGGGQSLFGQCPNRPSIFQTGASLTQWLVTHFLMKILCFYWGSVCNPKTDLIVKVVSAYPEWLNEYKKSVSIPIWRCYFSI